MILSRLFFFLSLAFSVILKGVCDEVDPKTSVVFVIDKTLSMGTVIEKVKTSASVIFDSLTSNAADSPIQDFVLVLFGDPDVSEPLVCTERAQLAGALRGLALEDGGACPERALAGLAAGLRAARAGCFVYLFTDAGAADHADYDAVKRLAQDKQCQIVFILTNKCKGSTMLSEDVIVYTKLAQATSGQVFHMHEQDIDTMIVKYVKDSVSSRRVVAYSGRFPAGEDHSFDLESDSKTKDLTVAITAADRAEGARIQASITGPDGDTVEDTLMDMGDIVVLKVSNSTPGQYSVEFSCKTESYVVVTARSDVRFRHAFSAGAGGARRAGGSLRASPAPDTKNYLYILLSGDNVRLQSVRLLDHEYHAIEGVGELPLRARAGGLAGGLAGGPAGGPAGGRAGAGALYVTQPFRPPERAFRISVTGVDTETNTNITRYGCLMIETERFVDKIPTVKIEGATTPIDYNGNLRLNCTVEAYPEPRIEWRPAARAPAATLSRAPPYNYYSVLELNNLTHSETYECHAENKLGRDNRTLAVEVKPEPHIEVEGPTNQTLHHGERGVLHCKVDSYPPAEISWILARQQSRLARRGELQLSADNSTLTLHRAAPRAGGQYACRVTYRGVARVLLATVTLLDRAPKFEKPFYLKKVIKEDESIDLTCRLVEGNPQPKIIWYRRLTTDPSARLRAIKEELGPNSTYSIRRAGALDAGVYRCAASNQAGRDSRVFSLAVTRKIEVKPTVKLNTTDTIVVEDGTSVSIRCTVTGEPEPDVTWLRDGTLFEPDILTDRTLLRLRAARAGSRAQYACRARNRRGAASAAVTVAVYHVEVSPPYDTRVEREERDERDVRLPCRRYVRGVPQPALAWTFVGDDGTARPVTDSAGRAPGAGAVSVDNGTLTISSILRSQRGQYTCEAARPGPGPGPGPAARSLTFHVDVFSKYKTSECDRSVEGDLMLKIRCDVSGNPAPSVTWERDGLPLAAGVNKYTFDKYWLFIQNINRTSTEGNFKCFAKNTIFGRERSVFQNFRVLVERSPPACSARNTRTVLLESGQAGLVTCFLPHEEVDRLNWYRNRRLIHSGELQLRNASAADAGEYTCRVSSPSGAAPAAACTRVVVGAAPAMADAPRGVAAPLGAPVALDCSAPAKPLPRVTWRHNGKKIREKAFIYNFTMEKKSVGKYECVVTNDFGTTSRTFNLVLK